MNVPNSVFQVWSPCGWAVSLVLSYLSNCNPNSTVFLCSRSDGPVAGLCPWCHHISNCNLNSTVFLCSRSDCPVDGLCLRCHHIFNCNPNCTVFLCSRSDGPVAGLCPWHSVTRWGKSWIPVQLVPKVWGLHSSQPPAGHHSSARPSNDVGRGVCHCIWGIRLGCDGYPGTHLTAICRSQAQLEAVDLCAVLHG